MHTRETRRILLHQARGMSGGSKNITRDFLIISELYFISISVNAGIAKTVWRFVDQLLWHTRETRRILLHQARGMSGGSKNITRDFLFNSELYFRSISVRFAWWCPGGALRSIRNKSLLCNHNFPGTQGQFNNTFQGLFHFKQGLS